MFSGIHRYNPEWKDAGNIYQIALSGIKRTLITFNNSFLQEKEKKYWIIQNDYLSLQSNFKTETKTLNN